MTDRKSTLFFEMEANGSLERIKEDVERLKPILRDLRSQCAPAVRLLHLLLISKVDISADERAWIFPEIRSNLPEECRSLELHLEIVVRRPAG